MATNKVVTGDRALLRRINTIQEGLPRLVSRERLGAFLLKRMTDRFDRQEDPDGRKWKERSENTAGSHPILNKQGNLRDAIRVLSGAGSGFGVNTGAGFRIGVESRSIVEGSRTVNTATYGKVHQQGNRHVPKRRFLGIGALDVKAVDSLLRREIKKLVNKK